MLEEKALVLAYNLRKPKMMSFADANDARDRNRYGIPFQV